MPILVSAAWAWWFQPDLLQQQHREHMSAYKNFNFDQIKN
jgi:hypothetical protein